MKTDSLQKLIDLFPKSRNRVRRLWHRLPLFNRELGHSDSEATFYVQALDSFLRDESKLESFRRPYDYREILEHVDFSLGMKYLECIKKARPDNWQEIVRINLANDVFGKPFTYEYKEIGRVSPTTLRYIATALDIGDEFSLTGDEFVAEVGVGYGGQASVINRIFGNKKYCAFDLPQVLDLSSRYIFETNPLFRFEIGDLANQTGKFDLLISNYAFSELAIDLQREYLKKVLLRARNGYMIMNSGRGNATGRTLNKMDLKLLLEVLPNARIKDEIPKTGADNYVLLWSS